MTTGNDLLLAAAGQAGVSLVEVGNSAMFDSANSEYLSNSTVWSTAERKKWTMSFWINKTKISGFTPLFESNVSTQCGARFNGDSLWFFNNNGSTSARTTSAVFRDLGWYHLVFVWDSANATEAYRMRIYINGVEYTDWSDSITDTSGDNRTCTQDSLSDLGSGEWRIGYTTSSTTYSDMYLAEFCLNTEQTYSATNYGEFDDTGLYWTPKSSDDIKALTFGTNGFYLNNVTNAQTDASGEGNHFTNNNTVVTSTHTPTNKVASFNPLIKSLLTMSNGNRTIADTNESGWNAVPLDLFVKSGKWYGEFKSGPVNTPNRAMHLGIIEKGWISNDADAQDYPGFRVEGWSMYHADGTIRNNNTTIATGGSYGENDYVGIAFDLDNGAVWFSVNGTWGHGSSLAEIEAGTTTNAAATGLSGDFTFCGGANKTGAFCTIVDEADWNTAAPSGFLALNTTNIAAATTRTVSDVYKHWANSIWTDDSSSKAITGFGFQPDFLWSKKRTGGSGMAHSLTDVVRGVTKILNSNNTAAEATTAVHASFDSDGFTTGSWWDNGGDSVVTWAAKLGGSAVSNTDGSITSSVSANQTLGMSVGTYAGSDSAGTVGHGLDTVPEFIMVKALGNTYSWAVWHKDLTNNTYKLILDQGGAQVVDTVAWNSTNHTAEVFSVGAVSSGTSRAGGGTYMFVAFSSSEFISIGSYEGNNSTDGPMLTMLNSADVPISPIWVMFKMIGTATNWDMFDIARNPYNSSDLRLFADNAEAEGGAGYIDILSGGVKIRNTNGMNDTYFGSYIAIGIPMIDPDGRILGAR